MSPPTHLKAEATLLTLLSEEGVEASVNLPEDNHSLIARLLAYLYTGSYSTRSLTKIMPGIQMVQFSMIVDDFECGPEDNDNFEGSATLHANMFALADKFDVPDLLVEAKKRFLVRFSNMTDSDDYYNGEEVHDEAGPSTEADSCTYAPHSAQADDKVIRAVYALPATVMKDIRMAIVQITENVISFQGALEHKHLRACIRETPDFAADLATLKLAAEKSRCTECNAKDLHIFHECSCGNVMGCKNEWCHRKWEEASFCAACFALGTIQYPRTSTPDSGQ